jgi:hypothetical protein
MGIFDNLFAVKQTATIDSVQSGIDAVQKQIDELKTAVAVLQAAPATEVVPVQAGGRRRTIKRRRTNKNKHRK